MPIEFEANVFSVSTSVSKKSGDLCANVVFLNLREKGKYEAYITNKEIVEKLMKTEGTDVMVKAELLQSKFGDRINILDVVA